MAVTYVPLMQTLLGTAALGTREWLLALGVYVVVELEKCALRAAG